MTYTTTPSGKLAHLEGWRGVAALTVFIAHFGKTFGVDYTHVLFPGMEAESTAYSLTQIFVSWLSDGDLAVFIFWFMSAYVLSLKLFNPDPEQRQKYLITAALKRYVRLMIPVFVVSLSVFFLLKAGWIRHQELAQRAVGTQTAVWLQQYYSFQDSFVYFLKDTLLDVFGSGSNRYNPVLWTMQPELYGSWLVFAVVALFGTFRLRYYVYAAMMVYFFATGMSDVTNLFYFTFVAGLAWCDVSVTNRPARLGSAINSRWLPASMLLLSFTVSITNEVWLPIPDKLLVFTETVLRAIALTWLIHNTLIGRNVLSVSWLQTLGRVSFSLYLIHLPLLFSLGPFLFLEVFHGSRDMLPVLFAALLSVSLWLAAIFATYVDGPAIRRANRWVVWAYARGK